MTQHSSLTPERWATFSLDQQILMIANEMHRGSKLLARVEWEPLRLCYERVLRLVDLTVEVNPRPTLRRELLRWREVVAGLHVVAQPTRTEHVTTLRVLLRFTPEASRQIPFVAA